MTTLNENINRIDSKVVRQTDVEEKRQSWIKTTYPFNTMTMLPLAIADAVDAPSRTLEAILRETSVYIEMLSFQDYLENMQIEFQHYDNSSTFKISFTISQPDRGRKMRGRQWYKYTIPRITSNSVADVSDALINAFESRLTLNGVKELKWFHGDSLDITSHEPLEEEVLASVLDDAILDSCVIRLQRMMISVRSGNQLSKFFRRFGEIQNFSANKDQYIGSKDLYI